MALTAAQARKHYFFRVKFPEIVRERMEFADYGVRKLATKLRGLGYDVEIVPGHDEDMRIKSPDYPDVVLRVEVKMSRPIQVKPTQKGFGWLLYKQGYSKRIDEDLVILGCASKREGMITWLVVPLSELAALNRITIPRDDLRLYSGQWAKFIERWDLIPLLFALKAQIVGGGGDSAITDNYADQW